MAVVSEIETERLILRAWRDADLAPFAAMNANPRVCEFFPATLSREESDAIVARVRDHFDAYGYGLYAVEAKEGGAFIGFTGFNIPRFDAPFMPAVEIGWRLSDAHWGRGYATEAATAVLRHDTARLGGADIVSFPVPDNVRSRRVMEKIGLRRDPAGDFDHPGVPAGHPLKRHVLYRPSCDVS